MIGFGMDDNVMGGPGAFGSPGPLGGGHPQFGLSGFATNTATNLPGVDLSGTQYGDSEAVARGILSGQLNYNDLQGAIQAAIENPTAMAPLMGAQVTGLTETQTLSPGMQQAITHALSNPNLDYSMSNALAQAVLQGTVDMDEAVTVAQTINNINPVNPGTNINYDTDTGLVTDFTENIFNPNPNPVIDFMAQFAGPAQSVDFKTNPATVASPTPHLGMGMGGGPDAANMSLDDFGIPDPLGLDNTLATNLYSFPNQFLDYYEMDDFGPTLEFNTTIPNPAFDPENIKNNPQDVWDAIESIPDFNLSFDPDDMSMAMVSTEDNPWGYNQSVIDALNASFDTGAVSGAGGEALQEALAQRAAETIIAQQAARRVTPQSNRVTIPVSSGPDIVIDVTPPEPRNPVRSRPVRPENVEQRNPSDAPIRIAAKTIAKPKAFKKLPKFAQQELRRGEVPTTGSDAVQDMVRAFLGGQEAFGDSGTRR